MLYNKIIALLGFAAKSGKLSYGMAASLDSLKSGKARLIISAEDVSAKSQKEAAFFSQKNSVDFLVLNGLTITAVSDAVGRRCGVLSINDSGFADALLKAYSQGGNANDEQI